MGHGTRRCPQPPKEEDEEKAGFDDTPADSGAGGSGEWKEPAATGTGQSDWETAPATVAVGGRAW